MAWWWTGDKPLPEPMKTEFSFFLGGGGGGNGGDNHLVDIMNDHKKVTEEWIW